MGKFLDITCKDLRVIRLQWTQNDGTRKKLVNALNMLAFPGDQRSLFAFSYKYESIMLCVVLMFVREDYGVDGWNIYSPEKEFKRQGIERLGRWRITKVNEDYKLCDSYPGIISVPVTITGTSTTSLFILICISDDQLKAVFAFRSKGRIPALSWVHPKNNTSITRCSQPLAGITRTRCTEDESLIRYE